MKILTANFILLTLKLLGGSMLKVTHEIRQQALGDNFSNDAIANIRVSGDAAWQLRGFASVNVTVALISGGKVIDTAVLTKYITILANYGSIMNIQ